MFFVLKSVIYIMPCNNLYEYYGQLLIKYCPLDLKPKMNYI